MTEQPAPELLPTRATYRPEVGVDVELRGVTASGPVGVVVRHLGDVVLEAALPVDDGGLVRLGALPPGGYGVEVTTDDGVLRTAVEVTDDPRARLRYGFVADHRPGRDLGAVLDNVRRLHLNGVQLYDWAYRHADLLGGGEEYTDPLGQPVSLAHLRDLVVRLGGVGAEATGYAAVYAVGPQEWPDWEHLALLRSDGTPDGLGDFLHVVDPAADAWLEHLAKELQRAAEQVGLPGFHLDQYGFPRRSMRADGVVVDLTDSFVRMLHRLREALPDSRLVFNNVNDFPTTATAATPQDAVYIEVWPPHVTLDSLARLITRARAAGGGKPVVLAAYQHVYDTAPADRADLATRFTMATAWSHGGTQLLAGEADRLLVDPYYVRNHVVEASTAGMLKRWYDFLVEHDELLLEPALVEVTGTWVGDYNHALDVTYADAPVTEHAEAGGVWRRVVEHPCGSLLVHLVNLVGQVDTHWDAPREDPAAVGPGALRVRRVGTRVPRVRVADPDGTAHLVDVPVRVDPDDAEYALADLPEPSVWQVVVVDL